MCILFNSCRLTVPDFQPNIGLFWYFFIEMFDHFRSLFIYSFQINATILYLIGLSIRFRRNGLLLMVSLLAVIATFKSYPSTGDVGLILSLLPLWTYLFHCKIFHFNNSTYTYIICSSCELYSFRFTTRFSSWS